MTTTTSVEPPTIATHPPAGPVFITSRAPDLRVMRLLNPVIRGLLRSPLHGLLSEQILLLTYSGRRSGRSYTLPVGYVRDGDALLIVSQHSELKQWWRNLRGGALVSLFLRGHRQDGRADVIEEPDAVAPEVERLMARLGAREASRQLYMGLDVVPPPTREQLAQALKGVVIVRITPNTTSSSPTPTQPEV